METKFTKGPWIANGRSIKQDFQCIGLSADAGQTIAAVMGGETSGPHFVENNDECEANASLIAAAPELFYALVKLREDAYNAYADSSCNDAFELADKAIAKATGQ